MPRLEPALMRIRQCDEWVCLRMNGALRWGTVLHLFRAVSWLGNGIFWYALMLALLVQDAAGAALPVLHMAFVGAVCTATYSMVKRTTGRARPYAALPSIAAGTKPLDAYSFPSGHTLHAVAFTMVATSYFPALTALLAGFTLLTAASRIVLGLHYPTDVLAGAALGALIAGASFFV